MTRLGWMGAVGLVVATAIGCGDDQQGKASAAKARETGATGAAAAEGAALATPPLGVAAVKALNYTYGKGAAGHKRAVAGYKAHNWAEVKAGCQEAIGKDEDHLDAHRLLATALAQEQKYDQATEHLLIALAADWLRFGPRLEQDTDLAAYLASPQGRALVATSARLEQDFHARAARGLWLLGRRSTYKRPKPGVQSSTTRGELYSYDLETRRYLRLTHTNHEVAGWLRSPQGDELVLVGFSKLVVPAKEAEADDPPTFKKAWVETRDPTTLAATSKRATFDQGRALAIQYGAGGQLLVARHGPASRWGLDEPTRLVVDRSTGKVTRTKAAPVDARALTVTPEDVDVVVAGADGITASWVGEPPQASSLELTATGKRIELPAAEPALQRSLAWSPGQARLAIVTYGDPCTDDQQSLYVADAASGKLTHLLTAASHFHPVWIDADRLAYEDGTGAVRIRDVAAGKEVARLGDRAGVALHGLGVTSSPICKDTGGDFEDAAYEEGEYEDEGAGEPTPDESLDAIVE